MTTIKLSEAKAHLGRFARQAGQGERFVIADRNKAIAQLVPLPKADKGVKPKLGLYEGLAVIPDDFDAAMPDFERDYYGE